MATPQRRSSRLRSSGTPGTVGTTKTAHNLGAVMERDETPATERSSISALVAGTPGAFVDVKTPKSRQHLKPSHAEMHPEHAHQSTVKVSNEGLSLGFSDRNPYGSSPLRPSHSRPVMSPPDAYPKSSPGYQFSFNSDNRDLSDEAQRIMDSVREEAARIKEQMRQEREQQRQRDGEADEEAGISGRRFAKPKSRFSDVHEAEFGKMRSIADHVSVWKNKLQGNKQVPLFQEKPSTTPLKRTRSRADLQDSKDSPASVLKKTPSKVDLNAKPKSFLPSLKRTQSKASINGSVRETNKPVMQAESSRLENTSPAKRRKTTVAQDVSSVRPSTSDSTSSKIPTPGKMGASTGFGTPTKASLARTQHAKTTSPSKLPASSLPTSNFARSRSLRNTTRPSALRTASGRLASAMASKVSSIRSILHRPGPKYSDDPVKIAAGTHVPMPQPTPTHHESTPSLPPTPRPHHTLPRPSPKRVEFAPDTKGGNETVMSSPLSHATVEYPQIATVEYPQIMSPIERCVSASPNKTLLSPDVPTPKAAYPTPAKPSSVSRQTVVSPARAPLFSNPPTSGDFTFTHEKRITFSSEQSTPQRLNSVLSPPIPASTSIRPVGSAASIHISPSRLNRAGPSPGAGMHMILAVPHGINNKKRARDDEVDSSDIENMDPKHRRMLEEEDDDAATEQGSPRKRTKMSTPETKKVQSKTPIKSATTASRFRRQTGMGAGSSAQKKKPGLSLARLNFLSAPKNRR